MEGSTTAKSPKFTRKVRRGLFWIEQLLPGDTIQQMSDMGYKAPALKDAQAALAWIAANSISPDLVEAVEKLAEVVLDPSTPTVLDPAPDAYAPERVVRFAPARAGGRTMTTNTKIYAYCPDCENYVYREPGKRHGDGQVDSDDHPVWLLADEDMVRAAGLDPKSLDTVDCGC